jgi:hypothetical protein
MPRKSPRTANTDIRLTLLESRYVKGKLEPKGSIHTFPREEALRLLAKTRLWATA